MGLEPDSIDPSKVYLLKGSTVIELLETDDALWNGDNIQRGPGIFKRAGGSAGYSLAARRNGQQFLTASTLRNLYVFNASAGSTPKIQITPGAYNSLTPTNAIASPLTVSGSDTLIWAEITYNSSNIATSVLFNHGTTLPTPSITPGTAGTDYYSVSTIVVTTGANASVQCLNDFISGNQGYAQCATSSQCWLK